MSGEHILISTSSFGVADPEPLVRLEREGMRVELNPYGRVLTEEEIATLIVDVDGLIAGTETLSENVLSQASRLKVISRVGVGIEKIDLEAAARRGVDVFTTPDSLTDAVAELTVGAMLSLLRGVPAMNTALHEGRWEKQMGGMLRGKTVGIVGLGRIGRAVAKLLEPFGVQRLARDEVPDSEWAAAHGVEIVSLDELLHESDIVTVHASGRECLLGAEQLALLRPGALVLNAARGGLVDEEALRTALLSGRVGGCFLDTFVEEPYSGPLCGLPNVLLTPHIGSYAREARVRMEREAVDNLLSVLRGSPV